MAPRSSPTGNDAVVSTFEDTPVQITLTATDLENDPLTYTIVSAPTHGSLTGAGNVFLYSPASDYHGTDSFKFKVNDGVSDSAAATISITIQSINDQPVANPLQISVNEDASVALTLTGSDVESPFGMLPHYVQQQFISNLTPIPDGLSGGTWNEDTGTIFLIRNVSGAPAESYEFTTTGTHLRTITQSNFVDTEAIAWMYGTTYAIAEENNNQRITICQIAPGATSLNRLSAGNITYTTPVGNLQNLGVESLCYDPDADRLYYCVEKPTNGHWYIYSMNPATGVSSILCDLIASIGTSGVATDLTDMVLDRATRTFLIASHESKKVVRVNFSGVLLETISIPSFGQAEAVVLSPDRQTLIVGGEAREYARLTLPVENLTYRIVTPPSHGTLSGKAPQLNYTPFPNFCGQDTFSYVVSDGLGDSLPADVVVQVAPFNDAPQTFDQNVSTVEDTDLPILLLATDPDGDALTFTIISPPILGVLVGTGANRTYQPGPNFHGVDSFSYKANDGQMDSNAAVCAITVTAVDDPGKLHFQDAEGNTLNSNLSSIQFSRLNPGSQVQGQFTLRNASPDLPLTGISTSILGAHPAEFKVIGIVPEELAASTSVTFQIQFLPTAVGIRNATLSIASNDPAVNPFTIALAGTGNTPPTFAGHTVNLQVNQTVSILLSEVLSNVTDADGDAFSVTNIGASNLGVATVLGANSFSYTAATNEVAVDTVPVTITDALGATVTGNVTLNIAADAAMMKNVGLLKLVGTTAEIEFYGVPGQSYSVQRSSDLATWDSQVNVIADHLGRICWTDPGPVPTPCFYRAQ